MGALAVGQATSVRECRPHDKELPDGETRNPKYARESWEQAMSVFLFDATASTPPPADPPPDKTPAGRRFHSTAQTSEDSAGRIGKWQSRLLCSLLSRLFILGGFGFG